MSAYAYVGVIMMLVGLFEVIVTPLILKRVWAKNPPARPEFVIRMTRLSGFIVMALGVFFFFGLMGKP